VFSGQIRGVIVKETGNGWPIGPSLGKKPGLITGSEGRASRGKKEGLSLNVV